MTKEPQKTIECDDLYGAAIHIVRVTGRVSISYLQRHLVIGYNRACRLMEAMEYQNIVSHPNNNGVRRIIEAPREDENNETEETLP